MPTYYNGPIRVDESSAGRGLRISLTAVDATTQRGLTGQTGTVYVRKGGSTAFNACTNAVVEQDSTDAPGAYSILLTATEVNALGRYAVRWRPSSAGSADCFVYFDVVGYDPYDKNLLDMFSANVDPSDATIYEVYGSAGLPGYLATAATVTSASSFTLANGGTLMVLPADDGAIANMAITCMYSATATNNIGVSRRIISYTASGGAVTVDTAFTDTPAVGDIFVITGYFGAAGTGA